MVAGSIHQARPGGYIAKLRPQAFGRAFRTSPEGINLSVPGPEVHRAVQTDKGRGVDFSFGFEGPFLFARFGIQCVKSKIIGTDVQYAVRSEGRGRIDIGPGLELPKLEAGLTVQGIDFLVPGPEV